jgi:hypothetical protein
MIGVDDKSSFSLLNAFSWFIAPVPWLLNMFSFSVAFLLRWWHYVSKSLCNLTEVFDKASVVSCKTYKSPYFFFCYLWFWSIDNFCYFLWVCFYASLRHNVSYLWHTKWTLSRWQFQVVFFNAIKNWFQALNMFFICSGENYHIVYGNTTYM